jgi:hypothetical protein
MDRDRRETVKQIGWTLLLIAVRLALITVACLLLVRFQRDKPILTWSGPADISEDRLCRALRHAGVRYVRSPYLGVEAGKWHCTIDHGAPDRKPRYLCSTPSGFKFRNVWCDDTAAAVNLIIQDQAPEPTPDEAAKQEDDEP